MTNTTSTLTTIEDFGEDGKGHKVVFANQGDFLHPVFPGMAEFIFKASKALTAFRKEWLEEHAEGWEQGVELDVIPVLSEGMIMGYMAVSEIDGVSYDYIPTKRVPAEEIPLPEERQ